MACATPATDPYHGEPTPYLETANATADVDRTLSLAATSGKKALIVMGANWCHDSRALAAHFEKPKFQTLLTDHYHLVYVDVGMKNRNIDLAQRFGVEAIIGTPTVFITRGDGTVLNADTAPTWRNAASRDAADVYAYFAEFATRQ